MWYDLSLLVSALQTFGIVLGTAGTTFAELFYLRALKDGVISQCEEKHIRATFWGLRFGMSIVLLTSVALIVLEFLIEEPSARVSLASFWMMQTLTLVILVLAATLSRKLISFAVGSAGIFVSWWMLLVLAITPTFPYTYGSLLLAFLVATPLVAGVFLFVRGLVEAHTGRLIERG